MERESEEAREAEDGAGNVHKDRTGDDGDDAAEGSAANLAAVIGMEAELG